MISSCVFGLIGNPVEHSLSPAMHNAAFEELGMDCRYALFNVNERELKDAIEGAKALRLGGLNVTIPHKEEVMAHCDDFSKEVSLCCAVNTLEFCGNDSYTTVKGHNTDIIGVQRAVGETLSSIEGKKEVVIVGAGGAAKAAAFGISILDKSVNIKIVNRTESRAEDLSEGIKNSGLNIDCKHGGLGDLNELKDVDLLINATPIGMHPNVDECVVPPDRLQEVSTVFDMVYNPLDTKLLSESEDAGCEVISGVEMLVHQGAASFEIWTGREAPVDKMREAVMEELKS